MRLLVSCGLSLTLAVSARSAQAARSLAGSRAEPVAPVVSGPEGTPPDAALANPPTSLVAEGERHWAAGEYSKARQILEPLATSGSLADPATREKVLTYLADAAMNDPELPVDERRERAQAHLNRLMDADPRWRMPDNLFSPDLFQLYLDLREERAQQAGELCRANLLACRSDVDNTEATLSNERQEHAQEVEKLRNEEVEVRNQVARSRIFAAIPFGVGQFYNGDRILGGLFLATELAVGGAGLGLLIYRRVADGCVRTQGFQAQSVMCDPRNRDEPDDDLLNEIQQRRKAEEAMGWTFLGLVVVDIIVAQVRFKPIQITSQGRYKRRDLDEGLVPTPETGRKPRRRHNPDRASFRVHPAWIPAGASFRFDIAF